MPNCNIIGCGIKRGKKQPNITLHRLPANKRKRELWLETIGVENVNMSTKSINICSLHFEESCFNRTLNKVTLRDEALPSRTSLVEDPTNQNQPGEILKSGIDLAPKTSGALDCLVSNDSAAPDLAASTSPEPDLFASPSSSPTPYLLVNSPTHRLIKKLKDRCRKQSKKIKGLHETVRRQRQRIAQFKNIVKHLKGKKIINSESQVLL